MSQLAPPTYFNKLYDPLLLYAQTMVSPGATAGPNIAALINPHGMSMELLEIRWQIYPSNTLTNSFGCVTGMGVGVKLDLGDIPLIDADVPLNGFGNSRDDADVLNTSFVTVYPDPNVPTVLASPFAYRWRLKYPLLIPPGGVVSPLYTHLGQNHFPVTVDTIFVCRTLPPNYVMPASVRVPWVGSYNSISFDNLASQAAGRENSSELDIINPFRQPLELARLTGRASATFGTAIPVNVEDITAHRFQLCKLRIRSRSGNEVARSATPFNGLFPSTWRAWDIPSGCFLQSGEFYKMYLTVDATSATAPDQSELGTMQFAVTGIGYRQLPLKVFSQAAIGGTP